MVRRFTLATGAPLAPLPCALAGPSFLAVSEDGASLAAGAADGVLALGNASGGLASAKEPSGRRQRIALSPDGRTLVTGASRALVIGDAQARAVRHEAPLTSSTGLAAGDGARWILAAGPRRVVRRASSPASERVMDAPAGSPLTAFAATGDGRVVAVGREDGGILIWPDATRDGAPLAVPQPAAQPVLALGFDPAGKRLAALGGPSGYLNIYDAGSGRTEFVGSTADPVTHAAVGASFALAATASSSGISLFHPGQDRPLATFSARVAPRGALAVAGPSALWAEPKGQLARCDDRGHALPSLEASGGTVTQIVSGADGHVVATLAADGTISLWQLP